MADLRPPLRFVVVSAPRSGTGYAAKVFSALGLQTGHEMAYHLSAIVDGNFIWPEGQVGESSWLAAPLPSRPAARRVRVPPAPRSRGGSALARQEELLQAQGRLAYLGRAVRQAEQRRTVRAGTRLPEALAYAQSAANCTGGRFSPTGSRTWTSRCFGCSPIC